jgi:capsular exopolysaccharide synthesis family protein
MPNDDSLQLANSGNRPQEEVTIDLKKIFYLIVSNWYYFIFTLLFALICAFFYIKYTIPVYNITANLLLDEKETGVQLEKNPIVEGFRLGTGTKNLDNQIMVLSSRTLINRTLNELNFDIEYYRKGPFNKVSFYPNNPIKIIPESADSLPRDVEFLYKYLDNNMFTLNAESEDSFALHTQAIFGSIIKYPGGSLSVERNSSDNWLSEKKNRKIYFISHSRKNLVASYKSRLKVLPVSKVGTIVNISLEGTNKTKEIDFLNKLLEIFLYNSLDKKNGEAVRIIQFIDDQLIGISDSLVIAENRLQQFRSTHRVMDLSKQGQAIIEQAMNLENEKARIEIEGNYYNYLAEYISKNNVGEIPIAPATIGITDPGLTQLVANLAEQQGELYSKSMGEKNPLQSQLALRVRNTKEALRETLNGVMRANNMAKSENLAQIHTVNAQATALPVTERQLLGIERKFKLNDQLYTFLLEKRAEAQIQKASNMPDNEIIDSPVADISPVKPKKRLIYLLALLAGVGFTLVWIFIADSFSTNVKEDEDINRITDIPISGHIPHIRMKKNIVVLEEPGTITAEAFRSLRSRMQFFTKEALAPVILISSSMTEEGKTFTAINLASAYSLIGKKTVLVGFDLRKPKIYTDFGLGNDNGVSTWLIGKDGLQDIIKKTQYENLSVITSGPVPPNPSELISLKKTEELLKLLKENYECIIIDSSPIGIVSDSSHLSKLADTTILVVRQNITFRDQLRNTVKELRFSDIKSVSIVVNDLGPEYKGYRYDGKYGYKYSNVRSKKA